MPPETPSARPALIDKVLGSGSLNIADLSEPDLAKAKENLSRSSNYGERQRVVDRIGARLADLDRDTSLGATKVEVQSALKALQESAKLPAGVAETMSTANTVTDMGKQVIAPGSTTDQRVAAAGGLLGMLGIGYVGAKLGGWLTEKLTGSWFRSTSPATNADGSVIKGADGKPVMRDNGLNWFGKTVKFLGGLAVGGAALAATAKPIQRWAETAEPISNPGNTVKDLAKPITDRLPGATR